MTQESLLSGPVQTNGDDNSQFAIVPAQAEDKTALSYWYSKLLRAGLPVPKTAIVKMPDTVQSAIFTVFDGSTEPFAPDPFFDEITAAAVDVGFPCFLRTDHTSGKHEWSNTCFVRSANDIQSHILQIAYFSECNGMFGELPWKTWAVREFLPTIPFGVCTNYGYMPICREFRFFVNDGRVVCSHPYWPLHALTQGGAPADLDYAALCRMDDEAPLVALAERAGSVLGGSWSIDILETRKGWYITDLAEARTSWHWPECSNAQTIEAQGAETQSGSVHESVTPIGDAPDEIARLKAEIEKLTSDLQSSREHVDDCDALLQQSYRRTRIAEQRCADLTAALTNLANAADSVGVRFFDSDDLSPEVEAMQAATLSARALAKGTPSP